jgi:hypothetical protein
MEAIKMTIELVDLQTLRKKPETETLEIPLNGNSLDLLQAVYRSPDLPLPTRMRAAIAALPHETPRLAVQALITEQDVATVLDRRIEHLKELRRREANANGSANKLIEAKPIEQAEPAEVEVKPTPTSMYRALNSRFNRRA